MLSAALWYGSDHVRLAAVHDKELLAAYELLLSMWTPVLDGGRVPTPRPDDASLLFKANETLRAYLGTSGIEEQSELATLKETFDQVKSMAVIPCYTLTSPNQEDGETTLPPLIENIRINDSDYTEDDHYMRFLYRVTVELGADPNKQTCADRKAYRVTLYTTVLIKK